MTDEQLECARKYADSYAKTLGYAKPNLSFVKGNIEFLDRAVSSQLFLLFSQLYSDNLNRKNENEKHCS